MMVIVNSNEPHNVTNTNMFLECC